MTHVSPKVLAQAIGVSESSLKRWVDQGRLGGERTAGGHRRIALAEAIRFVREAGLSVVRPELLGLVGDRGDRGRRAEWDGAAEALYTAFVEDRPTEAVGLVVSLYLGGASLGWIFDVPMRSALARIGELWNHGPEGVFLEHRATETCLHALARLRPLVPDAPAGAPMALGGGQEDDVYRLPSVMAALVLAEAGFRVRDLGPDTPTETLLVAIRHLDPQVVWLSLSVPPPKPHDAVADLRRVAETLGAGAVLIGGRGSVALPPIGHPRVHRLGGMAEMAAYARAALVPTTAARAG